MLFYMCFKHTFILYTSRNFPYVAVLETLKYSILSMLSWNPDKRDSIALGAIVARSVDIDVVVCS